MDNVTVLPYVSNRCTRCGRELPKRRKSLCYICNPPRKYKAPEPLTDSAEYTLQDRVAMARAYGLSYGAYMDLVHAGGKLPTLKHPIMWPVGSAHGRK